MTKKIRYWTLRVGDIYSTFFGKGNCKCNLLLLQNLHQFDGVINFTFTCDLTYWWNDAKKIVHLVRTQIFPKNYYFLLPDSTRTYHGVRNVSSSEIFVYVKFYVRTKWVIPTIIADFSSRDMTGTFMYVSRHFIIRDHHNY